MPQKARCLVVSCALAFVSACTPAPASLDSTAPDSSVGYDDVAEISDPAEVVEETAAQDVAVPSDYIADFGPPWECAMPEDCYLQGTPEQCTT